MSQPGDIKRKRKPSKERNKENKNKKIVQSEDDVIGKSKAWMKNKRFNSEMKVSSRRIREHSKISVNPKPMPSLSDLEKMFEDSDDEVSITQSSFKEQIPTRNDILLPEPQHKIKDKNIDMLTNTPEEIIYLHEDSTNVKQVVAAKRPKKRCIPYVVDTTEHPRIPKKPSSRFCKDHDDYGINSITNNLNNEAPLSRKAEASLSDNSNDSSLTIICDTELNSLSATKRCIFSPLPSTSSDNEIFLKNDQLLMDSLCDMSSNDLLANGEPLNINNFVFNESNQDDMEVINSFDNSTQNDTSRVTNNVTGDDINLIEPSYETITIDDEPIINRFIDDSVQIIDVDSYEPSTNITPDNSSLSNSDCVLIDVDVENVLAENQLLLTKYKNKFSDSIINVVCEKKSNSRQENLQNVEDQNSNQTLNMAKRTSSILESTSSPQASQPVRNLECPICMESLSKENIVSTFCGHVFCMHCIKQALKINGKKCPICRKVIRGHGSGYHKIFWPF